MCRKSMGASRQGIPNNKQSWNWAAPSKVSLGSVALERVLWTQGPASHAELSLWGVLLRTKLASAMLPPQHSQPGALQMCPALHRPAISALIPSTSSWFWLGKPEACGLTIKGEKRAGAENRLGSRLLSPYLLVPGCSGTWDRVVAVSLQGHQHLQAREGEGHSLLCVQNLPKAPHGGGQGVLDPVGVWPIQGSSSWVPCG